MDLPASMDKHLDVVALNEEGGLLLGASSLSGRYWLGSLWYYADPSKAPDVEKCSAGVTLEAGLRDAVWTDQTKVLVGLDTGGVALWELGEDNKVFTMLNAACEHDNMVTSVSVNSNKTFYASASYDHSIKTWNPELQSTRSYTGHSDIVWNIRCHPTEPSLFLTCSQDGRTILWDVRESKPATVLGKVPSGFSPTCVQWQPNSHNMFATGDEGGHVIVQDLRKVVEKTVTYQPHNRFITRLAFCPQQPTLLASCSEDCKLVVASVTSKTVSPKYSSCEHKDFVSGLTWGKGGDNLWTSSWDGKIIHHYINDQPMNTNGDAINGDIKEEIQ